MADGRREHDYDVAIATIGYLGKGLNKDLEGELNPIRAVRLIQSKTEEMLEDENQTAWLVLKRGLSLIAGKC